MECAVKGANFDLHFNSIEVVCTITLPLSTRLGTPHLSAVRSLACGSDQT